MGKATIDLRVWDHASLDDVTAEVGDPNGCSGDDYWTPRALALYAAMDASVDDYEYALCRLPDGRWALCGLTVEGHRYAVEITPAVVRS